MEKKPAGCDRSFYGVPVYPYGTTSATVNKSRAHFCPLRSAIGTLKKTLQNKAFFAVSV